MLWAWGIFAVALIFRLIYLNQFQSTPFFANHVMDMKYHHDWALALSQGINPIDGPFFRAPFYPYFLAAIYWLVGESNWIPRLVQVVLGSGSAALVYLIGNRVFNRKAGIIAGLIVATYGPLILYDAQLLIPSLVILLNLMGIFAIIRAFDNPNWRWYSLAGLMLGLSAIARPTILLFAAAVVLYLIWHSKRGAVKVRPAHILLFCLALKNCHK